MEYNIAPSTGYEGFRNNDYLIPAQSLEFREIWPYVARLKDVMLAYPDNIFKLDLTAFTKSQQQAFTMILELKNVKIV